MVLVETVYRLRMRPLGPGSLPDRLTVRHSLLRSLKIEKKLDKLADQRYI